MTRVAHNRLSQGEWVSRARETHGDRYIYDSAVYVNSNRKLSVICRDHGPFETWPANHVHKGQGCPSCAGNRKSDACYFVNRSQAVHGDRYDYSNVEYKNNRTNVVVRCPDHGEFEVSPSNHIRKQIGCKKCSVTYSPSEQEWIRKASSVHGDAYDYSVSRYSGSNEKVRVICPTHGAWDVLPVNHVLRKSKCPKCAIQRRGLSRRSSTEDFIAKAIMQHGSEYDYSKVEYETSKTDVLITCLDHGDFWVSPNNHLQGRGCVDCTKELTRKTKLYLVRISNLTESFLKVGITCQAVTSRFRELVRRGYTVEPMEVVVFPTAGQARQVEKVIHRILGFCQHTPSESFGGETECFSLDAEMFVRQVFLGRSKTWGERS